MARVLHILDHSLPLHSGYSFRTRAILKAQEAAGLEIRGITGARHTAAGPAMEEVEGLTFLRVPGPAEGLFGLREMREIERLRAAIEQAAAEWRPDILHAHSPALCGMAGLRAARRLGLPLVYEIRAFWEDAAVGNKSGTEGALKYRMTRALENRVVAGADAVFTISEAMREDLVARGHSAGKIGLAPNGVDLELFGEALPRDETLARELGLDDGPVIGFIGSFYDYEGLGDLIAALPQVRARHQKAQLLLVGGGPVDEALRAQALASPAANAIHFAGRVPHDEVARYYSLVDILAFPRKRSRLTELTTPLKPLEAMAQGRLVAASEVGGHEELIDDRRTGVLFAPDDPGECASVLCDLLDERHQWDAIRARAKAHVAAHHDWSHNVQRYQAVYHNLLGEDQHGRASSAA